MLITTADEIKQFLSSYAEDNNHSVLKLQGAFDNSENDFLIERIGAPLLKKVNEEYKEVSNKTDLLAENASKHTPYMQLIVLCQRVVVYDAFARQADISAISVSSSGMNQTSADGYDTAGKDAMERFKQSCRTEAQASVNRLLVKLEEWAQAAAAENPDADITDIATLWKQSRYYYHAAGLFINTATTFNEFIDIYESREKFIKLLPDLRFVHDFHLIPELGEELAADLLGKMKAGKLSTTEAEAVRRVQRTAALFTESRNKMFKRPEARDEALHSMKDTVNYIRKHQAEFDATAMQQSPIYVAPPVAAPDPSPCTKRPRRHSTMCKTRGID